MAERVKVQFGQSLFDVCIQEYGSIEALVKLRKDNANLDSLTDVPTEGIELIIERTTEQQAQIKAFKQRNLQPITGLISEAPRYHSNHYSNHYA